MSLPNTVLKIVSKHGTVVDFELEKIIRAIRATLEDIRGSSRWSHDLRARKYAERVAGRICREFYDMTWLKSDFIVKYVNYSPGERKARLKGAKVTERLAFAILETFLDTITKGGVEKNLKVLEKFIAAEIHSTKIDPHFTDGLFPKLSEKEHSEIEEILMEATVAMSKRKMTADLLYPSREYVQDMVEKELKDIGEVDVAESYMIFREGRRKIHAGELSPTQFTNNGIHREMVNRTLQWNIEHECETVFDLNDWILGRRGKDLRELIEAGEKRYHADVRAVGKQILDRKDEVKVVIVAGPSSSNKTTTTCIIEQELKKAGLRLKQLNIDNYFFDLSKQPKDEFGDYDFEMPEAIDMEMLNENLEGLLASKVVKTPHYNFKLGRRDKFSEFHVEEDEVILIDCLHGLYRKLTESVANRNKFKIFIESMNVVRNINGEYTKWADVRMLKRMIRDAKHRGYGVEHTLAHWPYVRKGELKHIIPYIFSTDAVLNSGLPYELPVLKAAVWKLFPDKKLIRKLLSEGRLDPYIRGMRMHALMETVEEMPDIEILPGSSPIREFIGGSTYIIPHND